MDELCMYIVRIMCVCVLGKGRVLDYCSGMAVAVVLKGDILILRTHLHGDRDHRPQWHRFQAWAHTGAGQRVHGLHGSLHPAGAIEQKKRKDSRHCPIVSLSTISTIGLVRGSTACTACTAASTLQVQEDQPSISRTSLESRI